MIKLVSSSDYDFDAPTSSIVEVYSRGVDRGWVNRTKTAAVLTDELDELRPEKNATYIHCLALGATEKYGPNRNGDGFRRDECKKAHHRFVKSGRFHRNHDNKDPDKAIGSIVKSAYNDEMDRVELIVKLDNDKAAAEVQKLAEGKELPVSMGCVLDPDYPVLTVEGYKPISEIEVGDRVLTHEGRWQRVTELRNRTYTGPVVDLEMNGLPWSLPLTADHPMMVKVFSAVTAGRERSYSTPAEYEKKPFDWAHVEHLEKGDYIKYQPATYDPHKWASIGDIRMARMMGFYLAEGSLGYNGDRPCTVVFNCSTEDELPRMVPADLSEIYPDITCTIRPRKNSEKALAIEAHSTELGLFMEKYIGAGCRNKSIPPEIFVSSEEVRLAFVGAWLSGDGFVDKKGIHWSTANFNLALQGRDLLASLGILSSIYKINHKAGSGFSRSATCEYTLNISHADSAKLLPYSERKLATASLYAVDPKKSGCKAVKQGEDGSLAYRVKGVTHREVVDSPIYNFEVEEDESYTLAGLVSHNCKVAFDVCSICGHKAPSPKHYCEHTKMAMTRVLDDGRQVYVDNPNPDFFETSSVGRPADRIGFTFRKVASADVPTSSVILAKQAGLWIPSHIAASEISPRVSEKLSMLSKLAQIEKEIEMNLTPTDKTVMDSNDSDSQISDDDADKIGDKIPDFLGKMHQSKVVMPLSDFLKLLGNRAGFEAGDVQGDVEKSLPGVFGRMLSDPMDHIESDAFDGEDGDLPMGLSGLISNMIPSCGMDMGPVRRRITIAVIKPKQASTIRTYEKSSEFAEALASAYASYKLAFLTHPANQGDSSLTRGVVLQHYHSN